jgi:hypothetical protein
MISSRADYHRSGGHAAVAGKVVEDWFLAHAYEAAGLPVSAWIGHGQIAYRMYPGGLGDMVIGFDKNFATAAGEVRWPWMLAVLLWLSGLFWAAWCLPASLLGWPLVGDPAPLANLVPYTAFALQLLVITRPVGRFRWISLVFPLPVLFFLGVFLLAILNLERGQVVWKGRRVSGRCWWAAWPTGCHPPGWRAGAAPAHRCCSGRARNAMSSWWRSAAGSPGCRMRGPPCPGGYARRAWCAVTGHGSSG